MDKEISMLSRAFFTARRIGYDGCDGKYKKPSSQCKFHRFALSDVDKLSYPALAVSTLKSFISMVVYNLNYSAFFS